MLLIWSHISFMYTANYQEDAKYYFTEQLCFRLLWRQAVS